MSTTTIIERGVTVTQLAQYPMDDGNRYELIDGELHVTTQPHWRHQFVALRFGNCLDTWVLQTGQGVVLLAAGVIFASGDAVAPDLIWVQQERLHLLDDDGTLHGAPDLAVEIVSSGADNAQRDRETKLALYDRYGVTEYWIVDRFERQVDVYRRDTGSLSLVVQVQADALVTSPLLPGFACHVETLFAS